MNIIKKLYLKWKIQRDEQFLINKGFRKAKESGLEVNIGGDYICISEKKGGRIYLPLFERGVDARELVELVADDYPKITKRYLTNKKRLS